MLSNRLGTCAETLRTVGLTGQSAPGTLAGSQFRGFSAPTLNNAGHTAFSGGLIVGTGDVNASNTQGIWSEGNGSLSLVARANDPAPGTPAGALFRVFETQILLSETGDVAFVGELRIGSGGVVSNNQYGVWEFQQGALSLIARERDPAPGTPPGAVFSQVGRHIQSSDPHHIAYSDAGQVAFFGRLVNTMGEGGVMNSNSLGMWTQHGALTTLFARHGDPAPDTPAGTVFAFRLTDAPVINGLGKLAFSAGLAGAAAGITNENDRGIWSNGRGSLSLVARKGSQAPGFDAGRVFNELFEPVMNSNGDVAFISTLQGGPPPPAISDNGIWSNRSGDLSLIVSRGMQVPGVADDRLYSFMREVLINASGNIAFTAVLQGPDGDDPPSVSDNGIWSDASGELKLVALASPFDPIDPNGEQGTPVPGSPPGTFFSAFVDFVLNGSGQVAFEATTTGPDPHRGIWAQDRAGVLRSIVQVGGQLDVDDGPAVDLRTVATLDFLGSSGNEDGLASAFNDSGHLAFAARFTDDSWGIFVSNVATVPEPSGLIYALAAAIVISLQVPKWR